MNLYRVSCSKWIVEYILATDRNKAMTKFIQMQKYEKDKVKCEFICKRDSIIPTVEPRKEIIK